MNKRNDIDQPLPVGWRFVKVGDVCEVIMGQSPEGTSYNQDGIGEPLLNGPTEFGKTFPTPKQWTTSPTKYAEAGDILLCVRGGTTGRMNIADRRYCIGRGLAAIRGVGNQATTDFLFHLLNAVTVSLLKETAGSTFPNLPGDKLINFKIPLPPINEQKRISAILEEQLNAVQQAREAAKEQLAATRALASAYMRQVFNNSEVEKWQKLPIAELIKSSAITYHQDGNHGELHPRNRDFVTAGVKFLTAKHLNRDGSIALDRANHITGEQAKGLRIGFAKANDVLLAHNATVGPVGLASPSSEDFIVGTSLTIFRCNPEKLFPLYLYLFLKSESFQHQLTEAMKQTTRNQVPITRQRELFILLPPLEKQKQIAEQLSGQLQVIQIGRVSSEEQLEAIERLPSKLLEHAFNGQL